MGFQPSGEVLHAMKAAGSIYVLTLSTYELFSRLAEALRWTEKAWDVGIKMACGGDTGVFAHGDGVRGIELMLQAGLPQEIFLLVPSCRVGRLSGEISVEDDLARLRMEQPLTWLRWVLIQRQTSALCGRSP
jgi:hypothetical protein